MFRKLERNQATEIFPFSYGRNKCLVAAPVCGNVIGHGCTLGFPAVLLPQLRDPGSSISVTLDEESWIASVVAFSMFFGNCITPPVMDRAGRKWAHYAVTLPVMAGWLCFMLASSFEVLLIGRVFHGLAYGMFAPLRSVLIGEYTSPRRRGGFLAVISLAQSFGLLFVHFVGSVTSYQKTALIAIFFSIISLLMTIYSPESPSWLATKGRYDECRKVFIWLRGEEERPELEKMIQATQLQEDRPARKQNRVKEILVVAKKKEFYKPVLLMFAVYILLQCCGSMVMASYSTKVIHLLMGPEVNAHVWMVALDTMRFFLNIPAVYVINKVKRRTMLFATGSLCAGSHLAMAGYAYAKHNDLLPFDSVWIPGIFIILQMVSIAIGMVPLPGVIAGEVFPLRYRSHASSTSFVVVAVITFVVLKTFPGLISLMGLQGTYTLYSGILTACLVVAFFLLPETRGRTLQQIEEHFRGKPLVDPKADDKELAPLQGTEMKVMKPLAQET